MTKRQKAVMDESTKQEQRAQDQTNGDSFRGLCRVLHDAGATSPERAKAFNLAADLFARILDCANVACEDHGDGRYSLTVTVAKPN